MHEIKLLQKFRNSLMAVALIALFVLPSSVGATGLNNLAVNTTGTCKASGGAINANNCSIIAYLVILIKILSGLVGVVVVIMIAVGGIQYSSAGGNPQLVAAAKKRITNALIALVSYLFMFAFLQYLVPGGIL